MDRSVSSRIRSKRLISPSANDISMMTPATRGHAQSFNTSDDGAAGENNQFLNSTLALSPIGPRVQMDSSALHTPNAHIFSPIAAERRVGWNDEQLPLRERISQMYDSNISNAAMLSAIVVSDVRCRLEDVVVLGQIYAKQGQYQKAINVLENAGFPLSSAQLSIYTAQYWALRNVYGEHIVSTDSPVSRFTNRLSQLTMEDISKLPAGHMEDDSGASFPFLHANPLDMVYIHSLLASWHLKLKKPETALRVLGGNNLVHGSVLQITDNYKNRLQDIERLVRQKPAHSLSNSELHNSPDSMSGGDLETVCCVELGFEGTGHVPIKNVNFSKHVSMSMARSAFQHYCSTYNMVCLDVSTVLSNTAAVRAEALEAQGNRERSLYYYCKSYFHNQVNLDSLYKLSGGQLSESTIAGFLEASISSARDRQVRNAKAGNSKFLEIESHINDLPLVQSVLDTLLLRVAKRLPVELAGPENNNNALVVEVYAEHLLRSGYFTGLQAFLQSSPLTAQSVKLSSMLASLYYLHKEEALLHSECTKMVSTFTDSHLTWLACSRYYLLVDNPVQAHLYITRAHTQAPTDVSVWLCLGHISLLQIDVGKAIDAYRIAASIAPYDVQPLFYQASVLGRNGRQAEASTQFQKAVALLGCKCDLVSSNFVCSCDLGRTLDHVDTQEQAKKAKLSKTTNSDNLASHIALFYELGVFLYETEEYLSASKWLERALHSTHAVPEGVLQLLNITDRTNVYSSLAQIEYAHSLRHLTQFSKAFQNYKTALEQPGHSRDTLSRIYSGLGMTLHLAGDVPNAILMYNKVQGMDPGHAEIKAQLSKAVAQSTILLPNTA